MSLKRCPGLPHASAAAAGFRERDRYRVAGTGDDRHADLDSRGANQRHHDASGDQPISCQQRRRLCCYQLDISSKRIPHELHHHPVQSDKKAGDNKSHYRPQDHVRPHPKDPGANFIFGDLTNPALLVPKTNRTAACGS